MKKIVFAIVLVLTMGLGVSAQTDGFFSDNSGGYEGGRSETTMPTNPGGVVGKINTPQNATNEPLGSGLLVLTALGAGYAFSRRKK